MSTSFNQIKNLLEQRVQNKANQNQKINKTSKKVIDKSNQNIKTTKKDIKKEDDEEDDIIQKSQTLEVNQYMQKKIAMLKLDNNQKNKIIKNEPMKKETQVKKNESASIQQKPDNKNKEEKSTKNINNNKDKQVKTDVKQNDNKYIKDTKETNKDKKNENKESKDTKTPKEKENKESKENKATKSDKKVEGHINKESKEIDQKKENLLISHRIPEIKEDLKQKKNNCLRHTFTKKENNDNEEESNIKQKQTFNNIPFISAKSTEKLNSKKNKSEQSKKGKDKKPYNFDNIKKGNNHFKERYVEEKIDEIELNIKRMTVSGNILKVEKSLPSSTSNINNYEKESEKRKCNTEFLLIKEKAIISFNLKKYEESFNYLKSSGVIKNKAEFGEFLLVISGFDKFILGEFLAKEKPPNDKKEVLFSFINAIDMNYKKINFLDCLRFLLSRLVLPKDANLILVIMETFSHIFYEKNKNDENFIRIFNNNDAIYLLISTILALNTMFTRKDIKNMNIIKKEEFKSMNKDIDPTYADELYETLKQKPISLIGDYNEEIYKKLSALAQVKTKEINSQKLETLKRVISSNIEDKEASNDKDNNDDNNNQNKVKDKNQENEQIIEKNIMEQQYYEFIQDFMDLDIVRKTLRGNYYRKKSFNINTNLINFNEEDKKLLSRPNKFYRIQGSSTPTLREYIVFDDFKKLAHDKTIDTTKQKYKKYIEISDINDVYIGIDHGENLKKYIKAYPEEKKLSNNFISIIYNNHKEQIDIKTDDVNLALLWFKAMKSLLIKTKTKDEKIKIANAIDKLKEIRAKIEFIWKEYLSRHWGDYGKYIIVKNYEKYNYFHKILIPSEKQSKFDLLDEKKTLNAKTIEDFLKEIIDRFNKNSNFKLEYYEFSCLCYLGFPHKIRKKMWEICIENNLGLTKSLYLYYQEELNKENIDFCELDFKYRENSNIPLNPDYKLNQIIIDIGY